MVTNWDGGSVAGVGFFRLCDVFVVGFNGGSVVGLLIMTFLG